MKSSPFVLTLLVCGALVVSAGIVSACQCGPRPNVLDAYEEADIVFIGRIVSLEKPPSKTESAKSEAEADEEGDRVRSATLRVEKIYKGNLRLRQELLFAPGNGADCLFTFTDAGIGDELLLYVHPPKNRAGRWYATFCNRSRSLEGATEDLLYLDNMKKLLGKTRVSGQYGGWQAEGFDVANKKILIRGKKKTYETKTDEKGIFEIYDLPPGKYFLEPEMPKGWKIARMWLSYVGDIDDEQKSRKSLAFTLKPKRHSSIDVSFEPDNAIQGTVLDPNGNPMKNVGVYLLEASQTEGWGHFDFTNEKGEFRIESMSAGSYVLVVNRDGKITSQQNFGRLFYPGVPDRQKAALIQVGDGEVVTGINMVIPRLFEKVRVSGVLQFSDENPVADGSVEFKSVPTDGMDGDVREDMVSEGRFSLEIIKGVKGEIFGALNVWTDLYLDCPKVDALIKASGESFTRIKTESIQIEANQDHENLVLRLPFPRCKKKPRPQ